MTRLVIGTRIQMHAATSEWMQGDRYGTVVGYGRKRMYASHARGRMNIDLVAPLRVKLDKSGRTVRVHPENVFVVD